MVKTASTMAPIGMEATGFSLPATDGSTVSLEDLVHAPGLLVVFLSNHCPFVKHLHAGLAEFGREYQARGLAVVGINSNDVETHPADSPAMMVREVEEVGYTFPYLFDEDQSVAKAYSAACTPDFFLFDDQRRLVYRGQFDDSRPSNGMPVTGSDLKAATDSLLEGRPIPDEHHPSVGCNIKWKPGNAPDYFG